MASFGLIRIKVLASETVVDRLIETNDIHGASNDLLEFSSLWKETISYMKSSPLVDGEYQEKFVKCEVMAYNLYRRLYRFLKDAGVAPSSLTPALSSAASAASPASH
jgi:hypothetical protein